MVTGAEPDLKPPSSREGRSRELQIALEILAAASAIALEDQDKVGGHQTTFKVDDSPSTIADREIEQIIIDRLATFFPRARFMGEELGGTRGQTDLKGDLWVIDPIDGTTNYSLGLSIYAVSIGLIRDGKEHIGCIGFPSLREDYSCDTDGIPKLNGRGPLKVVEAFERHQFLCVPSSMLKWYHFDFAGNIRGFGSTVYHCLLVARGVAAGAVVNPFPWDIAAVLPLLRRAGGDLFAFKTGEPLDLVRWAERGFKPFPMIACSPTNFDRLRSAIKIHPLAGELEG